MKRLFYNCSVLMLFLLGWSMSFAQPGCPPNDSIPAVTPKVCVNSIPGTYDLSQEGTGVSAGINGYQWFSAVVPNPLGGGPLLTNPVTTNQVAPGTYYAQFMSSTGLPCLPITYATLEVASKPAPPFATMSVCASNLPPGPIAALAGGVYDLTQIPGIDKWYSDPALLFAIVNPQTAPAGTYYGVVDGNNTANGCESEVAVLTVNPAPYPPVIVAPVGTICVNPVTGTFDLTNLVLASNPLDPNYPFTIPIPAARYKFWQDTATTGGLLVALTGGVVPAGTYMVSHTTFACESMPLEFTLEPREVAPVLSANDACVDQVTGDFDLCLVTSTNPAAVDLTWYPTLADVENGTNVIGTCPGGAPLNVGPGTYYATYMGADCESAPSAFVVNETPATLVGYNCQGVIGNNPPPNGGNCTGPDGEQTIRLWSCTDEPFTVANVEAEITMNSNYGIGLNGGVVPNAVLTYYASYADAVAGTPTASLAATVALFAANAAANNPQTELLWVTQSDPNTLCESAPTGVRLRMRARPEITVTTPADICLGGVVDLYSLVTDDKNVSETWNIYATDPSIGPAVLLSTSPANGAGEPDGSVVFSPPFATPGTFTYWYEAVNEGAVYDNGCNEVASVTITVLEKPVITAAVLPAAAVCSNDAFSIVFLDANGNPIPSSTVNDIDVSVVVDGGLTVVSGPTSGNGLAIGAIAGDVYRNYTAAPLQVVYTVSPNGPLPQNCPGDTINVVVTINPEPIMTAGLSDTTCSYVGANLALSVTNGLSGVTYSWTDFGGSFIPPLPPAPNPVLDGPQASIFPPSFGEHNKYPNAFANYGRPVASADPITDVYSNISTVDKKSVYTITPISDLGCAGDEETAEVVTNPAPVITLPLADTICSGGTTNIALSVSLPDNIDAVAYKWDFPTYPAGVTGPANGSGGTTPGSFVYVPVPVPGQIFIQETFTNITGAPVLLTASLIALGDPVNSNSDSPAGCESDTFPVFILVNPVPVLQSNWPSQICSSDPTVNLDLVTPTETSGPGLCATGTWERNMGASWVTVSGVQTISNGDEFRYTCTTTAGCVAVLTETVSLDESPTMTPVPNPPLCADNVNLAARLVDLGAYEPTVTNSVGGAMAGSGEWHDIWGAVVSPTNNVTVRNGDTYCYVFNATNGCSDSVCYTFIVNELPSAVLTGGGTICPPATSTNDVVVTFTSTGPWTFYHSVDGVSQGALTSSTATYTIAGSGGVTGTYRIDSIVNGNGCETPVGYTSNTVDVAGANSIAAICRNITEQLDGNGFAAITGGDIDENSGYGCNSAITLTRVASPAIFTCGDLGPNPVTLSVFDPNTSSPRTLGVDSSTCVSIVTIEDNVNPSIACAAVNNPYDTDPGVCYWQVPDTQLDPVAWSDNCTVVSVEHDYTGPGVYTASSLAGAQFDKGSTTITWTATDQSGNQDVCAYAIIVHDNEDPIITACPPSRQIYTSVDGGYDCDSDIADYLGEFDWTDNCTDASESQSYIGTVSGAHLDVTTITFTVTDGAATTLGGGNADNTASCTATFTLIDDEAPVITCPSTPVTIQCDDDQSVAANGNASATDNCSSNITITNSDVADLTGCNGTGTIVRTFTADDNNVDPLTGNSNTASCVQVINVVDTEAPVVTGFSDPTEYCDFSELPRFTFSGFIAAGGTVSDNCGYDTTTFQFISQNIVGNCGAIVTETYAIEDNCGNPGSATVTFIVDDNVTPTWNNTPAIADTTVDCDQNTSSANLGEPTWTDNCHSTIAEADGNSTYSSDPADCGHYSYSFDRTFTVTDICGNAISHTQTITVQDTTAPAITCTSTIPGNTVDTDVDVCEATIGSGQLTASATDNCATANLSYSYVVYDNTSGLPVNAGLGSDAAGTYYKGSYTITFTATDPCGNASTCDLTLDVEDNQDPYVACVATLNVYLDDLGDASIDVSDIVTNDSDNCPGHTVALDITAFDCNDVTAVTNNTITVTATATDGSSNTSACTTDVTVIDNLPPTPDCQDIVVYLDGICTASIIPADVAGNASDNCGIVSTTIDKNSFDCDDLTTYGNNPVPPIDVTVTYTDPSQNSIDCVAKVTVKDTIPPSITCLSPAPVGNTPGLCEAPVVVSVPSTGDNCGIKTLTNDYTGLPSANATYPVGTTQVTWTIYDKAGNSTDCVIDVVVNDVEAPTAACKDITVQLDATGNASITAAELDNGSDDNCPGFVLTLSDYDFDCSDIQGAFNTNNTVSVTLTNTDGAGLTDQATCTVTVRDEVDPTAICKDVTVQLDANGNGSLTAADVDNGSNDACGIATGFPTISKTAYDCSDVGQQSITLTVMDVNGNIDSDNCTVTIEDNVNPIALCQDTTVQLDVNGNGVLTPAMVDDGSNDACGIASMTVSPNTFDCTQRNQTVVTTLTVTDNNGNVSTCNSNVLVKDEVSPTAQCRDLTIQLDANGDASITVADVDNGTVDNCMLVSVTLDEYDFDCTDVGTNLVTLTAVDADGNDATCIATITVEDNVNPTAICMNAVVELDSTGNGSIVVADIDNGSDDACGIASRVLDVTAFDCGDLGNNTVTLTITDNNGNVSTCQATVDVQDNINPDVDASDVTVCNAPGVCEAPVTLVASEWDNCTIVTRTYAGTVNPFYGTPYAINGQGLDASGTYPVGSATITFTVIDQSGNSDQVTVTVTVNDCEKPVITQAENLCGGSVTLPNVAGDCYQQFAWTTPTYADNCNVLQTGRYLSDPSVAPVVLGTSTLGLFPVGTTTVTYWAIDDYSATTSDTAWCIFDVVVEDTEDPQILNCPTAPISVNSDPGNCSAQVVLPNNITAIDNCPIVVMSDDVPAGSVFPAGTTTVTFTAQDNSGRTSTCVFDVVVADTEAPAITCPANVAVSNDPGECGATVSYATPSWVDNCSGFQGLFDPANMATVLNTNGIGDGGYDASNAPDFIVLTSSDNSTGFETSSVAFTAPDNGDLSFSFAYSTDDLSAFWDPFGYTLNGVYTDLVDVDDATGGGDFTLALTAGDVFAWVIGTDDGEFGRATAVVGNVSFGYSLQQIAGLGSGAQFPVGTTTETWVITDPSGNADTCSFDIVVSDDEDPTITSSGQLSLSGSDVVGGPIPPVGTSGTSEYFIPIIQNQTIDDVDVSMEGAHTWVGDLDIYLTSPAGTTVHLLEDELFNSNDDFNITFDDEAASVIPNDGSQAVLGNGGSWQGNGTGEDIATETGTSNGTALSAFDGESSLGPWKLTIVDRNGGDLGNLAEWSLEITYIDPSSGAPVSTTLSNDPAQCGALFTYANLLAGDNCPGVTITQTAGLGSGSMFPVGTTTETYVATDAAGNTTTYSFDVTVEDNEDPTISCPTSATIGNDLGDCDATLAYTILYNDNCSAVLTQTAGLGNGGSVAVGSSSTESYTVTDAAGNTAACSFTITVEDQEAPQISGCPANIGPVNNDPGQCGAVVTWNTNNLVTSDNCPGETLASNYQSGDEIPVGLNTITYTVTDAVGLTADCSFTIEVLDVEDPVITCPANVTVTQDLALIPNCGTTISGFIATATDNCSAAITNSYNANGADASDFYPIGTTTVTFTATDPAGNNVSCTADVTVNAVAPVASVNNGTMDICSTSPSITASGNNPGQGFSGAWTASPSTGVVFAPANAAISTVTFPGAGTYTLTWTVTSDCTGATATASFTVNVYDPPTLDFSCSSDPTIVGGSDGVACVTPSGGSGNFGYAWSTGSTSSSSAGLPAGTYSVVVTDLTSGCTSSGSVTLVDPPVTRICEIEDYDPAGFGVWFRLAPGSIGGNGNNTWVGGNGTYKEYASGEVQITGTIMDKVDNTKVWNVDIWLIGKEFWGSWGATNGWAGNAATVGTNYTSWTYYTLNGSKSTLTGAGSFAGQSVTLTHRAYTANGGDGGFQVGQAANNQNALYGMYGQFDYTGSYSGWGEISGRFNNCIGTQQIGPIAVLQGAYDGTSGMMRDDLRAASLVPTTEPYTGLGYTHVGGGGSETVAQSVLSTTGLNAIVDWVVVELRESANPSNVIASRSALMQADGDIVDVDGVSSVEFNAVADGDYYVAILHRNHVGIMTGSALTLVSNAPTATTVDFTTTNLYGGPTAYATVGAGFQALVAGDASFDGQVQNTDDVYFWAPSTGSAGYQAGDYDLDAQVQNTDKVYYWISNAGLGTAIPQ